METTKVGSQKTSLDYTNPMGSGNIKSMVTSGNNQSVLDQYVGPAKAQSLTPSASAVHKRRAGNTAMTTYIGNTQNENSLGLGDHLEFNKGLDYKKVQTTNPASNKRRQIIAKATRN